MYDDMFAINSVATPGHTGQGPYTNYVSCVQRIYVVLMWFDHVSSAVLYNLELSQFEYLKQES